MSTAMMTKEPQLACPLCAARERYARIAEMRAAGLTFREIGEKLGGMKRQLVHRAWKKERQRRGLMPDGTIQSR